MCGIAKEGAMSCCSRLDKRDDPDGPPWPQGHVFQYVIQGVLPGTDEGTMAQAFERAFSKWGQHSPYQFQRATGSPNLFIRVVGREDTFFQQNPDSQGYTRGLGTQNGPDAQVNLLGPGLPSWNFNLMHTLFLHEFGHMLGLGHASDPQDLMNHMIQNMGQERELRPRDIDRIRALTGGPTSGGQQPTDNQNTNNQPQNNNNNYYNQPQQDQNNYYNQPQQNQNYYNQPQQNQNYNYYYPPQNQNQNYNYYYYPNGNGGYYYQYYKRSVQEKERKAKQKRKLLANATSEGTTEGDRRIEALEKALEKVRRSAATGGRDAGSK